MKKGIVVLLALMLMTVSAMAETSIVEKIHYEGRGFIEVEFVRDVRYQDPAVTLRDQDGVEYPATIVEQDEADRALFIEDLPGGVTYDLTPAGIPFWICLQLSGPRPQIPWTRCGSRPRHRGTRR